MSKSCAHVDPLCSSLRENMEKGSGFAEAILKRRHPSEFRHSADPEEMAIRQDARQIQRYFRTVMQMAREIPEKYEP